MLDREVSRAILLRVDRFVNHLDTAPRAVHAVTDHKLVNQDSFLARSDAFRHSDTSLACVNEALAL